MPGTSFSPRCPVWMLHTTQPCVSRSFLRLPYLPRVIDDVSFLKFKVLQVVRTRLPLEALTYQPRLLCTMLITLVSEHLIKWRSLFCPLWVLGHYEWERCLCGIVYSHAKDRNCGLQASHRINKIRHEDHLLGHLVQCHGCFLQQVF